MPHLIDEIKSGFAEGFVVVVGKCVDLGTEWRVEQTGQNAADWITVSKNDLRGGPTQVDGGSISFDGFGPLVPLQAVRVRLGSEAKVKFHNKEWKTFLWYARDRQVAVGWASDRSTFALCGILFNRYCFDPIGVAYANWDFVKDVNEGFWGTPV